MSEPDPETPPRRQLVVVIALLGAVATALAITGTLTIMDSLARH